ncbi:MAG: hypothetical protein JWM74_1297 [Myxococcaceae bacterium]|nr:hypothetical protein [Myxococcaceae bacterium]
MPASVQRLLYRWFVQYNPLYLLSAVLVLLGLFLMARGLTNHSSLWGSFGVGIVTELYAAALIGGAALLTRIGLRRPAVCVALIAVVYQGDLILSTEMYPLLPRLGALGGAVWLVVFVAKLLALAWALRLRLSFSAIAVPIFGAAGIAAIPYWARTGDASTFWTIVSLWLFTLFAMAFWTSRRVASRVALDAWGDTVLRRATRAAWLIWGGLAIGHVLFWTLQYGVHGVVLVPMAALLATRWLERERNVVAVVAVTLVLTAAILPELLQLSALMSAAVFTLHALSKRTAPRHVAWAGYAVFLAAWTASWSGGAWPQHIVLLDVALSVALASFVWRRGQRSVLWPLFASYLHWSIQTRVVRVPQSTLSWGVTTVAAGFALLLVSLFTSWRLQRSRFVLGEEREI